MKNASECAGKLNGYNRAGEPDSSTERSSGGPPREPLANNTIEATRRHSQKSNQNQQVRALNKLVRGFNECVSWGGLVDLCIHDLRKYLDAKEAGWHEFINDKAESLWCRTSVMKPQVYLRSHLSAEIGQSSLMSQLFPHFRPMMTGWCEDVKYLNVSYPAERNRERGNATLRQHLYALGEHVVSIQCHFSTGGIVLFLLGGFTGGQKSLAYKVNLLKGVLPCIQSACKRLSASVSLKMLDEVMGKVARRDFQTGISFVSMKDVRILQSDMQSVQFIKVLGGHVNAAGRLCLPDAIASWITDECSKHSRVIPVSREVTRSFKTLEQQTIEINLRVDVLRQRVILITSRPIADLKKKGVLCAGLSMREQAVIECVSSGLSSKETADSLSISKRTVDKHLENIYHKFKVNNRLAAVRRYFELKRASQEVQG